MEPNKLIPIPKTYTRKEGIFTCTSGIVCENETWKPLAEAFSGYVKKLYDVTLTEGEGNIRIVCDAAVEPESYILDVDEEAIIRVSDYHGCSYALATVLQLIDQNMQMEKVHIEDKPDKDFRGLMVDLAREWHPYETLSKYVDCCFFYKIKYLHMHFMDDQGYTLPSEKFPKLSRPGKSYTLEEIEEFCRYAKDRGVIIIPEIEVPGHASSLNAAYPELFGNHFVTAKGEAILSESGAMINRDAVICPGSEQVFGNITALLDEVMELFADSPYIHLGADEVNSKVWNDCADCRAYMEAHGISSTQELYADFVARVTNYVLGKGRQPIMWEGVAKEYNHMISKDVIVIAWESHYQMPDELLEGGFRIINGSWQPLYIVPSKLYGKAGSWNVEDILKWNVYEWQHWWEHSQATLNPFHLQPTDKILGGQLVAWEMTYECEIKEIVVRLAALSERVWSVRRMTSAEDFWRRLNVQMMTLFRMIA